MNKTVLAAIAFVVLFVGLLVYFTMRQRRYRVEVCMEFRGRTDCRTAGGPTRESAERTAIDNACALLASGMADSMACASAKPVSVKVLQ